MAGIFNFDKFGSWDFSEGLSLSGLRCISFILGLFGILASYRSPKLAGPGQRSISNLRASNEGDCSNPSIKIEG